MSGREAHTELSAISQVALSPAMPGVARLRRAVNAWDLAFAILLAVVTAVHVPSLGAYFHGDDFVALMDPASKPILTHIANIFLFKDANFYWRPLGELYYLALFKAFGLDAWTFHLVSLLLFLLTLWLLYGFCLRLALSRPVALIACCLFGLLPSHVVSVAWITNAPRLLATIFVLASLIEVDKAARGGRRRHEALAWLCLLAAGLSDETALALAPVPLLFTVWRFGGRLRWPGIVIRSFLYALPVATLTPLQFMFTIDDEPRLADYKFGLHVIEQAWALSAQMALPLNSQSPLSESFASYSAEQWAAGALVIAGGGLLLLFGSWLARLLVVWTALALAPFTLWDLQWTAPRYVYMSAIPFSIVVAWLLASAWRLLPRPQLRLAALAVAAPAAAAALFLGAHATVDRNAAWQRSSEPFRTLAVGLRRELPEVPSNSRLVIYYGVWEGFPVWPRALVRTIYGDDTLDVVNVRKQMADSDWPRRSSRDVVVFYTGERFISVPPALDARTHQ